jgi:SSS family solute:Na+ symporter
LLFPEIFPDVLPLYYFPLTFAVSLLGCIAGTLAAPATDDATLKSFYRTVRPWGFWKPIHDKVVQEDPSFEKNKNFKRDMFNVTIGIVWQMCLTIVPIYIIIREQVPLITSVTILLITTLILKKSWYDRLKDEDANYFETMKKEEIRNKSVTV